MEKILIPTDFSETANIARYYAIQIAQRFDAEIILLNTYHISYSEANSINFVNVEKIASEESKKAMEIQLEYINTNYENIKVITLCRAGLLVDSVRKIIKTQAIDLIVLGTTGASGAIENMLGSNASSLVGIINVPIITVPRDGTINLPKRLVLANDLMDSGKEKIFDVLKEFTIGANATIDFLFIVKDEKQSNSKINRLKAANFNQNFDTQYHSFHFKESEDVEHGILEYIENKNFDLLVVVAHQRSFWESLFHKSISKALVKHAKLPILILPD